LQRFGNIKNVASLWQVSAVLNWELQASRRGGGAVMAGYESDGESLIVHS